VVNFVSIALGARLPTRPAALAIAVTTALALVIGVRAFGWVYAVRVALPVAVGGCGIIGVGWLVATIRALRAAREEIARLAVDRERLRFARDLHDLLGPSLSTITLKNELARTLVASQPDRATRELEEAISLARQALREVRQAVSGYRQPRLAGELRGARELLAAAGIACQVSELEPGAPALPPTLESVLAWSIREGVTNVVRHCSARRCTIQLACTAETVAVEVRDDGLGRPSAEGHAAAHTPDGERETLPGRAGTGLRSLTERAAQVGGQLEAGPLAPHGFRLRVALPLPTDGPAAAAPEVEKGESVP
jgi:two-component system sensor histidine kinase DesK